MPGIKEKPFLEYSLAKLPRVCVCVHLSMIHSEGCLPSHKIFMLVVHGSIIAISGLELFIGCTVQEFHLLIEKITPYERIPNTLRPVTLH